MYKIADHGLITVYAAKHKVDQQVYAVKQVTLRVTSHGQSKLKVSLEGMLKEVRLLAAIQDINILRYHHSWIEFAYSENKQEEQKSKEKDTAEDQEVILISPHIDFDRSANPQNQIAISKSVSEVISVPKSRIEPNDKSMEGSDKT